MTDKLDTTEIRARLEAAERIAAEWNARAEDSPNAPAADVSAAGYWLSSHNSHLRALLDALDAKDAAIERLVGALEPFALFAQSHDGPEGLQPDLGGDYIWLRPSPGYPAITTDHFRAARATIRAAQEEGEGHG